ncbi:MAG: hypothetical protein AVDCRST_MAG65-545, partial [uncultured Solirubrobacteraceae bacterium]
AGARSEPLTERPAQSPRERHRRHRDPHVTGGRPRRMGL